MNVWLLKTTILLLVTSCLQTKAANIPGPEGKSIENIFSSLNKFKTNIISLISQGFVAPKKVRPPASQGSYHHVVLPPPPPHVPHKPYQTLYVTNPPHLGPNPHQHFETHEPHVNPQLFPIIDINIPAEVQFVENPAAAILPTEATIPSDIQFTTTTVRSDNTGNPLDGINTFNKEVDESLNSGPQSFVDSERMNAGIELASEIDEETIKNIPEDLWREDIGGIKSHCRKGKKLKVLKKGNTASEELEIPTPTDPEKFIE
jgi:hypothetical protein